MTQLFKNNASGRLSGAHNNTVLTINMVDSAVFPVPAAGEWYLVTMYKVTNGVESDFEIIKVTANDTGTDQLTVVRNQEGSGAKAYVDGDYVELRLTAGRMDREVVQARIKGRGASSGAGDPEDLTGTEALLAMGIDATIAEIDDIDRSGNPGAATQVAITLYGSTTAGSPTYIVNKGYWYRIGNLVFMEINMIISAKGGMVGSLSIAGLPFASTRPSAISLGLHHGATALADGYVIGGSTLQGPTTISLLKSLINGISSVNLTDADISDNFKFQGTLIYLTGDA